MSRIPKTVFISYRRTNQAHAIKLYQLLEEAGYDPFLDIKNLGSGAWRVIIQREIQKRAHFILLLTPSAVERLTDPQDVLRFEIETALDNKRNLVPLMFEGFSYSDPRINTYLTGKLAILSEYNAFPINWRRLKKDIHELTTRFMSVHPDDVVHPEPLDDDDEFAIADLELDDVLVMPEPELIDEEEASLDMPDWERNEPVEKSAPKPPMQPTTPPRQREVEKEQLSEEQKKSSVGIFGRLSDIFNPPRRAEKPAETPPSEEGTFSPSAPPPPQSTPVPRPIAPPAPIPLPSYSTPPGGSSQTQSMGDMSEAELLLMMRDAMSKLPTITDDDLAAEEADEIS